MVPATAGCESLPPLEETTACAPHGCRKQCAERNFDVDGSLASDSHQCAPYSGAAKLWSGDEVNGHESDGTAIFPTLGQVAGRARSFSSPAIDRRSEARVASYEEGDWRSELDISAAIGRCAACLIVLSRGRQRCTAEWQQHGSRTNTGDHTNPYPEKIPPRPCTLFRSSSSFP